MATIPDRGRAPFLLVALVLCAVAAFPSEKPKTRKKPDFALLYTTVYAPNDFGAYGVRVKVRRAHEQKARWEGYSDHAGEVAFRVPPGPADYVVWADVKVKKGQSLPETKVHVEGDERINLSLHLTE